MKTAIGTCSSSTQRMKTIRTLFRFVSLHSIEDLILPPFIFFLSSGSRTRGHGLYLVHQSQCSPSPGRAQSPLSTLSYGPTSIVSHPLLPLGRPARVERLKNSRVKISLRIYFSQKMRLISSAYGEDVTKVDMPKTGSTTTSSLLIVLHSTKSLISEMAMLTGFVLLLQTPRPNVQLASRTVSRTLTSTPPITVPRLLGTMSSRTSLVMAAVSG